MITTTCRAFNRAAVSTTWRSSGRPASLCNTFGVALFIRVPFPAAMTTTSTAAISAPRSLINTTSRIISALFLSAWLSACGFVQLSYNNAPDLIYWWLNGYVDLDDAQRPGVLADVAQLQRWHRAEELPRYAALLNEVAQAAPADLTADAVCRVQQDAQVRFGALLEWAQAPIGGLAQQLSPAQLNSLERKFANQNAAYRKKWIEGTSAQRFETRLERAVEQAERFYGRLGEPQRAVLRDNLNRSNYDPVQSLIETQRRQRATLAALRTISQTAYTPVQLRAEVRGWLEQMQISPDPAQRARQEAFRAQSCVQIAALHNSTTTRQRAHAAGVLRGYARDFQELSRAD